MEERFINYVKDKRVIIVGPSNHNIGKNSGEFIDSFDIVIRLNKSYPLDKKMVNDLGSRTDILYHCLKIKNPQVTYFNMSLEKSQINFLCSSIPDKGFFTKYIKHAQKKNNKIFKILKTEIYNSVRMSTNTHPNTGIITITDILQYPIKELYITGITFYTTEFYKGYSWISSFRERKNFNDKRHNQESQKIYLKSLIDNDDRIKIDDELHNILYPIDL